MSGDDLIRGMNRYYADRAAWHDRYMSYEGREAMVVLLRPIVDDVSRLLSGRCVLEVAAGTGNWTAVLAEVAESVLATDVSTDALAIARGKLGDFPSVVLMEADAYSLGGVGAGFTGAFASDWLSHVPKSHLAGFLGALHAKLEPGARVVFVDMLPSPRLSAEFSHADAEGNLIHRRSLPNGREYAVVKNYPAQAELSAAVAGSATDCEYIAYPSLARWLFTYVLAGSREGGKGHAE